MQNATLPRPELIQMADVLAHEKGIDKLAVLHAMEEGIIFKFLTNPIELLLHVLQVILQNHDDK